MIWRSFSQEQLSPFCVCLSNFHFLHVGLCSCLYQILISDLILCPVYWITWDSHSYASCLSFIPSYWDWQSLWVIRIICGKIISFVELPVVCLHLAHQGKCAHPFCDISIVVWEASCCFLVGKSAFQRKF